VVTGGAVSAVVPPAEAISILNELLEQIADVN
jgi:hypothetical protein